MQTRRPTWGRAALIGSTGFVGGVLSRDLHFDHAYASATIQRIAGETFDTVICAGAPAAMWRANADPDGDFRNLETLVEAMGRARIERLVLISTIAVLADPGEGADETTTNFETTAAYGRNRRWLEQALADQFPTLVVRLPALFGPGLKKNLLFDLRHPIPAFLRPGAFTLLRDRLDPEPLAALDAVYAADAATGLMTLDRTALDRHPGHEALTRALIEAGYDAPGFTHPDSTFQFYGLGDLADDIDTALQHSLETLHLAVEPWRAGALSKELTGQILHAVDAPRRKEDTRSRHAAAFGREGPYLRSSDQVLNGIRQAWEAGDW